MSRQHVVGALPPPVPSIPTYPILRPQKDGPLDLTLLADTGQGLIVHWVKDARSGITSTRVCWQYERNCEYHDSPLEWTWFMPCYDHRTKRKSGLRCAPREYAALVDVLGIDLCWARRRVVITPLNAGRGKLIEVVEQASHNPPAVLAAFDLSRSICHVLKCDHVPRQTVSPELPPDEIPLDPSDLPEGGGHILRDLPEATDGGAP